MASLCRFHQSSRKRRKRSGVMRQLRFADNTGSSSANFYENSLGAVWPGRNHLILPLALWRHLLLTTLWSDGMLNPRLARILAKLLIAWLALRLAPLRLLDLRAIIRV